MMLSIGDVRMSLSADDRDMRVAVDAPTERFLVDDGDQGRADVCIQTRWGTSGGEDRRVALLFSAGDVWQLYADGDSYRFFFPSPSPGETFYKTSRFDSCFTRGEVLLHRPSFDGGRPVRPLDYPLDELLMIHLLAQERGVEVHAGGVIDGSGRAYLFAGQSGAGKTTMARLWRKVDPSAVILSDERVILRLVNGRPWIYGTPWHGEGRLASASKAPLAQIFLLRHGVANRVSPQTGVSAVAHLMACSFLPFHLRPGLDFTIALFERIIRTVPVFALEFLPDDRVVEFIQTRMH